MMILRPSLFAAAAAFALLPACNLGPGGGGGTGDDDDAADDDDDATDDAVETTLQALNAGDHDVDTLVTVRDVQVSGAYIFDDDFVTFWVQDSEGGPGGGMTISTFLDVIEEFDPEESLYLGEIMDITGRFQLAFDEEIPRISVDRASSFTTAGYEDLPDPYLVEADEISGGFADRELWGVPVGVEDAVVETLPTFDNFGVFEADGIQVDDVFYWPDVAVGDELSWLAGILTPWYGRVTLMPRWDDDVWFEPAGCVDVPISEGGDTVQDVNCRRYFEGQTVELTGLTVVSGEFRPGNFFVQDLDAPAYGGVQVYDPAEDGVPAIGAVVDLTGLQYSEFNGQTELAAWKPATITDTNETNEVTATEVVDPCSLTEAHEGTLVTIPEVVLGEQSEWAEGRGYYPVDGCPLIMVGSIFFESAAAFDAENGGVGTITNLTGVVSDRFENLLINPRSSDDWEAWEAAAE